MMKKFASLSVLLVTMGSALAMDVDITPVDHNIELKGVFAELRNFNPFSSLINSRVNAVEVKKEVEVKAASNANITPGKIEEKTTISKKWTLSPISPELKRKVGIGAVALLTIGGIVYVVYKNYDEWYMVELRQAVKGHPYITAASVTTAVAATTALALAYKKGIKVSDVTDTIRTNFKALPNAIKGSLSKIKIGWFKKTQVA